MRLHLLLLTAAIASAQPSNCDPAIHDKIPGAQFRSATDCEIKFDASVRSALTKAFKPIVDSLTSNGWTVQKQSKPAIQDDARNRERQLFRMDFTDAGAFSIVLGMSPTNPELQRRMKAFTDATQKAGEQLKAGKQPSFEEGERIVREMQGATRISIVAVINFDSMSFVNFKGDYSRTEIPGGGFALSVPYMQATTGGDIGAANETMSIHLGHWSSPVAVKQGDGSETINVPGTLNKAAPSLSVDNLRIRVEANQALQQQILKEIDWSALRPLLPR